MTEDEEILQGLDLLGDWLDAKGYTEEAGLCTRSMGFIHKQTMHNRKLRAALKPFSDEASVGPMPGEPNDPRRCNMKFLLAAAAALKETENGN